VGEILYLGMKFVAKRFWSVALVAILAVFAHADKLFADAPLHKQLSANQATFSNYSQHPGEIERVEYNSGQIQMSCHRQPRQTHPIRHNLNGFSEYTRVSLYGRGANPVFINAGFTRLLRLLLFPHHSFD